MSWTAAEVARWRIPVPRVPGGTEAESVPVPPVLRPLSDRDRELLAHLAHGRSTAQIARAMSISTNTARTRIRRVSSKLAVGDRHEVVRAARALALV